MAEHKNIVPTIVGMIPGLRVSLGLAGIFGAVLLVYFATSVMYAPLALPATIGFALVAQLLFVRRWMLKLPSHEQQFQSLQATTNLVPMLGGAHLPLTDSAMEPVHQLHLVSHLLANRVDAVVECGSGTSTLVVGNLLRQQGHGHLYAIEQDEAWSQLMQSVLVGQALNDYVTLLYAPLVPYGDLGSEENPGGLWYSTDVIQAALEGIQHIDLLVIDGPIGVNRYSRFPALPYLAAKCDEDTLIVLDDTNRQDERFVLERWQALFDLNVQHRTGAQRHQAHIRLAAPRQVK